MGAASELARYDLGMRGILSALVVTVACGSPRPIESRPIEAHRADAAIPDARPDASPDAAIDAGADAAIDAAIPPDAAVDAAAATGPRRSVKDALADEGAVIVRTDDGDDTEAAPTDDDTEYEDGVRIVRGKGPVYCLTEGKMKGICALAAEGCKRVKTSCTRTFTYACFTYTSRTTNQDQVMCWSTYGRCADVSTMFDRDPEHANVSECVIFRPKAKKK